MLAKTEENVRGMLTKFRRCLERKELGLKALKSKIMLFKKESRVKKYLWKWEKETLETVKEWKYLDMWIRSNGAMTGNILQIKIEGNDCYEAGLEFRKEEI